MESCRASASVCFGWALGLALRSSANAQTQGFPSLQVEEVKPGRGTLLVPVLGRTVHVAGFSCAQVEGEVRCFIATVE